MAHDVFISHSSKDQQAAAVTCAALEGAAIRCWIASRDVRPGADFAAEIVDAIDSCRVMVIVSSSLSESRQDAREVEQAVRKGVPVLPMRIENVDLKEATEYFRYSIHPLDAVTPPLAKYLQVLVARVKGLSSIKAAATQDGESTTARVPDDAENGLGVAEGRTPARWPERSAGPRRGIGWSSLAVNLWRGHRLSREDHPN